MDARRASPSFQALAWSAPARACASAASAASRSRPTRSIYVDGVRVDNQTGTGITIQAFGSGVVSRLNDFDPDQIESIEVLKGPAAATLYGTEAARGVINIITKKGSSGGTTYNFKVTSGQNIFQNAAGRIATNYCHIQGPTSCTPNGTARCSASTP